MGVRLDVPKPQVAPHTQLPIARWLWERGMAGWGGGSMGTTYALTRLYLCWTGPLYKLGVICGVTRKRNYSCTDVYHANFLASSDGGSSWKLFFAEFWNLPYERLEESKKPFCCPVPDYHEYPGRCVVCENDSSIIMHPQSSKYYMGNSTLAFPTPGHCGGDTSEKLDFDFIYSSLLKVEEYAVDLWLQQGKEGVTVLRVQQPLTWQLVEGMSISLRAML
uniref:DUF3615 domain-containing protein n=1 Tax=Triticum aestivum TaxID=4565 RepID=A0A077RV72_WHEAT|nr:unnamed protein product [Triticum aestivum]